MLTVSSSDVFLLPDRKSVLVRLPSFEWDFSLGLTVELRLGGHTLDTKQIGSGNHEGRATILLSPRCDWSAVELAVRAMVEAGGDVFLEHRAPADPNRDA